MSQDVQEITVDTASSKFWNTAAKGIGISFCRHGDLPKVHDVAKNSPAYTAGIRKGDIIEWIANPEADKENMSIANFKKYVSQQIASDDAVVIGICTAVKSSKRWQILHKARENRKNSQGRTIWQSQEDESRRSRIDQISQSNRKRIDRTSSEEIDAYREAKSLYDNKIRADKSSEKNIRTRLIDTKSHAIRRSQLSDEDRTPIREADQAYRSRCRLAYSDEDRARVQLEDAQRKRLSRLRQNLEEHLAELASQREYFKSKYAAQKGTAEGDAYLKAKRQYLLQFCYQQPEEADAELAKCRRQRRTSVEREIDCYKKVALRKKQRALETSAERDQRIEAEDRKKISRRITKGLQLLDPEGFVDFLKTKRQQRAEKRAKVVMASALANSPLPCSAEEKSERAKNLALIFESEIQDSPTRVCISCSQLFFGYQTQEFRKRQFCNLQQQYTDKQRIAGTLSLQLQPTKDDSNELLSAECFCLAFECIKSQYEQAQKAAISEPAIFGDPEDPSLRVCRKCWAYLNHGKAPPLGSWNNLETVPLPPNLAKLNELSLQLLARRIPFQKISLVANGGQRQVKGGVINVPSSIDHTASRILPHNPATGQVVSVEMKKRLCNKSSDKAQLVHVDWLFDGLKELCALNPLYSDVSELAKDTWSADIAKKFP